MSEQSRKYPDFTAFYQRKKARRKVEAKRPVSDKLATVERLRDLEKSLAGIRRDNKAKRAAKQIKIQIKNR